MNQDFNKRGITNEEIKNYEEVQKEIYSKNKQIKRFRITSGGGFEDFDDLEEAIKYLRKRLLEHAYASINTISSESFQTENGNG